MWHFIRVSGVIISVIFWFPSISSADIKLGVAGPLTGNLASYGIPALRATELVVNEVNANGGINGETVVIVEGDDQCDESQAVTVANTMVTNSVVAVIGHICSNATEAALPAYTNATIPVMSPASTKTDLTFSGSYPFFFRTIPPDNAQAELIVHYALYVLNVEKIGLVHDGTDYGTSLVGFVNDAINNEQKGQVLLTRAVSSGIPSIVQDATSLGIEVLIYGGFDTNAINLFNEISSQSPGLFFIGGDGVMSDNFFSSATDNGEGALISYPSNSNEQYLAQKVRQDYIDEYGGEPGQFFLQAYAAASTLLSAIDMADSTNSTEIKDTLRSEKFITPIGEISFDDRGDVEYVGFSMYKVVNGTADEDFNGSFTPAQLKSFVAEEVKRWDYNENRILDLPDTVNGLRVLSGL